MHPKSKTLISISIHLSWTLFSFSSIFVILSSSFTADRLTLYLWKSIKQQVSGLNPCVRIPICQTSRGLSSAKTFLAPKNKSVEIYRLFRSILYSKLSCFSKNLETTSQDSAHSIQICIHRFHLNSNRVYFLYFKLNFVKKYRFEFIHQVLDR